tara:strand:+ start:419 stop:682 length:264 start_codon:yes stop_codon:yes gene_type:complete
MVDKWIQEADKEMEKRGTEGAFTREARKNKMSVQAYARKVIRDTKQKEKKGKKLTAAEKKLYKRAIFARNMGKLASARERRDRSKKS